MSQEEFEKWINNAFMLERATHPSVWRGDKEEIADWRRNPYVHPYTRGAYDLLLHLEAAK